MDEIKTSQDSKRAVGVGVHTKLTVSCLLSCCFYQKLPELDALSADESLKACNGVLERDHFGCTLCLFKDRKFSIRALTLQSLPC